MGCTCVLQAGWNAERFISLVEEHRVTAALLVPTQITDLLDCPGFSASRLKTLRHLNYAAAPMPPTLYEKLRAALPETELIENYGQSETGPLTVRRGHHPPEKLRTVGRPASNLEIKLFDAQGREAPAGMLGEVVVRGPNLLTAYDGDPEETARLYRTGGGWLWTGDLGRLDEDGFLTLVDRSKDMIISGGENIYPTEIENALYRHPAVAECAVFGIPDERWGEVPAACVVLRAGASATPETLMEFVAGAVARFKRLRAIEMVEALPRTAVGKVQKNELRASYRRKHGAAP
jgi:fatty-acyl-CoA synthase